MHHLDEGFAPPEACAQWCRAYPLHVRDEGVTVDLDWWNRKLGLREHEIRIRGRDLDGRIVDTGRGVVQRNDLRDGTELVDGDRHRLGLLFLCAAWNSAHPGRRARRHLPDVRNPLTPEGSDPLAKIETQLREWAVGRKLITTTATWSGWPDTPGVGVSLRAVFMWAVGVTRNGLRTQLVDQHGVSTLIHEGWLEEPSVSGFTLRRYDRYLELLHRWATEIRTDPALVEMWLVRRWNARLDEARRGALAEPTLF